MRKTIRILFFSFVSFMFVAYLASYMICQVWDFSKNNWQGGWRNVACRQYPHVKWRDAEQATPEASTDTSEPGGEPTVYFTWTPAPGDITATPVTEVPYP